MNSVSTEERSKRLGATDIAALLGLSPWRTPWELWAEKTGRLEPTKGNDATDLGQRIESAILDKAEEELGPLSRNVLCRAEGVDFPLASQLDSRVIASGVPCEAKTGGLAGPLVGTWGPENSDELSEVYLVQLSVQMLCSQSDFAHLYALLGGRGIVRYRVMRDESVLTEIVERSSRWWQLHVEKGIEPTITEPIPLAVLKRIRRQPKSEVEIYDAGAQAVAEWEAAKATKSAAEKTLEAAQAKLVALLGESEAGRLPDGRVVTYLSQTRRGYTVDETSFRTLRIKKG
jgi:putative phage-type endonuclease